MCLCVCACVLAYLMEAMAVENHNVVPDKTLLIVLMNKPAMKYEHAAAPAWGAGTARWPMNRVTHDCCLQRLAGLKTNTL